MLSSQLDYVKRTDWPYLGTNLPTKTFLKGQKLMETDSVASDLFVIIEGFVSVQKYVSAQEVEIIRLGPGCLLGDISVITNKPSTCDVIVRSDKLVAVFTGRQELRDRIREADRVLLQLVEFISHAFMSTFYEYIGYIRGSGPAERGGNEKMLGGVSDAIQQLDPSSVGHAGPWTGFGELSEKDSSLPECDKEFVDFLSEHLSGTSLGVAGLLSARSDAAGSEGFTNTSSGELSRRLSSKGRPPDGATQLSDTESIGSASDFAESENDLDDNLSKLDAQSLLQAMNNVQDHVTKQVLTIMAERYLLLFTRMKADNDSEREEDAVFISPRPKAVSNPRARKRRASIIAVTFDRGISSGSDFTASDSSDSRARRTQFAERKAGLPTIDEKAHNSVARLLSQKIRSKNASQIIGTRGEKVENRNSIMVDALMEDKATDRIQNLERSRLGIPSHLHELAGTRSPISTQSTLVGEDQSVSDDVESSSLAGSIPDHSGFVSDSRRRWSIASFVSAPREGEPKIRYNDLYGRGKAQMESQVKFLMHEFLYGSKLTMNTANERSLINLMESQTNIKRRSVELEEEDSQLTVAYPDINNWSFNLRSECKSKSDLNECLLKVFERLRLLSAFRIDVAKLLRFLDLISAEYKDRYFHDYYHAADVTITVYFLLMKGNILRCLSKSDVLALIIACIGHDAGHPGHNNEFEVSTKSRWAERFRNTSVLENIHARFCIKALRRSGMIAHLSERQKRRIENSIVDMILSTDIALHFRVLQDGEARAEELDSPLDSKTVEDRTLLLRILIKTGDLSNVTKHPVIAGDQSVRFYREVFDQGEKEFLKGLPVPPLRRRSDVNCFSGQVFFIDEIVKPLILLVARPFPAVAFMLATLNFNRKRYMNLADSYHNCDFEDFLDMQDLTKQQKAMLDRVKVFNVVLKKASRTQRRASHQFVLPERFNLPLDSNLESVVRKRRASKHGETPRSPTRRTTVESSHDSTSDQFSAVAKSMTSGPSSPLASTSQRSNQFLTSSAEAASRRDSLVKQLSFQGEFRAMIGDNSGMLNRQTSFGSQESEGSLIAEGAAFVPVLRKQRSAASALLHRQKSLESTASTGNVAVRQRDLRNNFRRQRSFGDTSSGTGIPSTSPAGRHLLKQRSFEAMVADSGVVLEKKQRNDDAANPLGKDNGPGGETAMHRRRSTRTKTNAGKTNEIMREIEKKAAEEAANHSKENQCIIC